MNYIDKLLHGLCLRNNVVNINTAYLKKINFVSNKIFRRVPRK